MYISTSKTQNAQDFSKLMQKVTDDYKICMVLSDQYPGLNSKEFKNFLMSNSLPIISTAVDAPFSNALNEILNQRLVNKIGCRINKNEKNDLGRQ